MRSEREPGFYWVRTRDGLNTMEVDDWTVGEWFESLGSRSWCVVGSELILDDSDIAEIGERITRDAECRVVEVLAWVLGNPIGEEFDKTVSNLKAAIENHLRAQRQ